MGCGLVASERVVHFLMPKYQHCQILTVPNLSIFGKVNKCRLCLVCFFKNFCERKILKLPNFDSGAIFGNVWIVTSPNFEKTKTLYG